MKNYFISIELDIQNKIKTVKLISLFEEFADNTQ